MDKATASGIEWQTAIVSTLERAELDGVADAHLAQVGLAQDAVLPELGLDEAERQARPVDGDVQLLQGEGQPADVVFASMRQDDPEDLPDPVQQVGDVGKDEVDAEHVLLRKHQARVHDEHLALPLEGPTC